jgi:hypothetical protein
MTTTVFFSWQVDTSSREGRNLIERALEKATAAVRSDATVDEAVRNDIEVDRDTKGIPGSPPIVETIFRKIDSAAVFVPDLTFIGRRPDGRPTPNPNVLIEYGWALKALGHGRIIPVMNVAYGRPNPIDMPFDLRHLRNPIVYDCPEGTSDADRKKIREALAKQLEGALRAVFDSPEFKQALPKPEMPKLFAPRPSSEESPGRFVSKLTPIGISTTFGAMGGKEVRLSPDAVVWLRLMPQYSVGREWSLDEVETTATRSAHTILPLVEIYGGYSYVRSHEGFGIYAVEREPDTARAVVFAFKTGEVWSCDTYWLAAHKGNGLNQIPPLDQHFRSTLVSYAKFLTALGVSPPFRWIAGMEDLRGRGVLIPPPPGGIAMIPGAKGSCLSDVVTVEGQYSPPDPPATVLRPFFVELSERCGQHRPDWADR